MKLCVTQILHFRSCDYVQSDSKTWTQFNSKRRLNISQTVGCGIAGSLLALRVYLRGPRSKLS